MRRVPFAPPGATSRTCHATCPASARRLRRHARIRPRRPRSHPRRRFPRGGRAQPARPPGRTWHAAAGQPGQAVRAGAGPGTGIAAALPCAARASTRKRRAPPSMRWPASPRCDGGGRLRPDPAGRGAGAAAPRLHQYPWLAAAALARCCADPPRHRGGRCRDRHHADADGRGPDTGAMLACEATPIAADDSTGSLHDKLAAQGARMVVQALERTARGETLSATRNPRTGSPMRRRSAGRSAHGPAPAGGSAGARCGPSIRFRAPPCRSATPSSSAGRPGRACARRTCRAGGHRAGGRRGWRADRLRRRRAARHGTAATGRTAPGGTVLPAGHAAGSRQPLRPAGRAGMITTGAATSHLPPGAFPPCSASPPSRCSWAPSSCSM